MTGRIRKTAPVETGAGRAAFRAIKAGRTWEQAEAGWKQKKRHRLWIKQARREWIIAERNLTR